MILATDQFSVDNYQYDAKGNPSTGSGQRMITRVEGGLTYTQIFDAENRLISVTVNGQTTQFIYDGDGNLVKNIQPDGTCTIYIGGVYEVEKSTCGGTVTHTTTYYPAAGALRVDGTLYYVLKDHLGSASVVTDASGNVVGEQRYYPFGETRWTAGAITTDRLFTGQREITGLGIYHYGARFYSPKLGRFLSADTIVPGYANPQSLNRYSYTFNNPIRYIDPSGHIPVIGEDENGNIIVDPFWRPGGGNNDDDGVNGSNGTGPITDAILNLPGSEDFYGGVATVFDSIAWLTDLYAAGIVTYGGIYAAGLALPGTVVGGPAVPTVAGIGGMIIGEFYAQPVLTVGNVFASLSTASTVIADTKAGNTRIENGVFSSNVSNSFTLTAAGWINKEAYLSLIIQSVALTNDFGWTSLPFQTSP